MSSVPVLPELEHDFGNDPTARGFVDGAELQATFSAHRAKLNAIIGVLDHALRNDNELRNGSVRSVTLHSEVIALIASAAGWKPKLQAAWSSIGNLTLSGLSVQAGGEWTATLNSGDRILVQDQIVQAENGLYVADAGAWSRASDANTAAALGYAFCAVMGGATRGLTTWVVTNAPDDITLETTPIVWGAVGSVGGGGSGGGGGSDLPDPEPDKLLGWNDDDELVNVSRTEIVAGDMVVDWISDLFTGDGSVPSFVLRRAPGSIDNMDVSIDGETQRPTEHYLLSGQTITFLTPPDNGAKILVRYGSVVAQGSTSYVQETRTAAGGEETITVASGAYIPGANTLAVYVNGLRLAPGEDFTEDSPTTFTLTEALVSGDILHLVYGQQYNANAIGTSQIATAAVTTPKVADGAITMAKLEAAIQTALGSAVIPTGMFAPRVTTTLPIGWVNANGLTIGSAFSGATGRANADTQALYEMLWDSHANTELPIQDSLGSPTTRGSSAAADFAANKRLPTPDMRGEFMRGLDAGRGVDASRVLGSLQLDEVKSHNHTNGAYNRILKQDGTNTGTTFDSSSGEVDNKNSAAMLAYGGAETRPRNKAYPWMVKL